MSFHFRCSACRGRNTLPRHWRDYKRPKRCKHCGAVDRFYVDKERLARAPCTCEGAYQWGPHRPGSPICERNRLVNANRARREGQPDEIVLRLTEEALMPDQPTLAGIEPAPAPLPLNVAFLGQLWRPSRLLTLGAVTTLEVWLMQAGSHLPICASQSAAMDDPAAVRELTDRYQRLQQIGTPALARGLGIAPAVVDGRECLRIDLTESVDVLPYHERIAA